MNTTCTHTHLGKYPVLFLYHILYDYIKRYHKDSLFQPWRTINIHTLRPLLNIHKGCKHNRDQILQKYRINELHNPIWPCVIRLTEICCQVTREWNISNVSGWRIKFRKNHLPRKKKSNQIKCCAPRPGCLWVEIVVLSPAGSNRWSRPLKVVLNTCTNFPSTASGANAASPPSHVSTTLL